MFRVVTQRVLTYGALFLCFILPSFVFANIEITEIMYDLEGGDTDREWIEVYNSEATSIDLSSYTFFEGDINHTLTPVSDSILPPGSFAVIVDDVAVFSSDWPSFSGLLFDSSFSLNNTGETLEIRDSEGGISDSVTYSSDWGALGNSLTLTKSSGSWGEAEASPGSGDQGAEVETGEGNEAEDNYSGPSRKSGPPYSSPTQNVQLYSYPEENEKEEEIHKERKEPDLFVTITSLSQVVAGAPLSFKAETVDEEGREAKGVRYIWNFGDGLTDEGAYVEHVFSYPGTYTVVVQAYQSIGLKKNQKAIIEVVSPDIYIQSVKGNAVEIMNDTNLDIDLTNWMVMSEDRVYVFPDYSYLKKKSRTTFMTSIPLFGIAELVFPSGSPLVSFKKEIKKAPTLVFSEPGKKEEVLIESTPDFTPKVQAAVLLGQEKTSQESDDSGSSSWILALFGVIVLGIAGTVGVRRGVEEDTYYE